MESGRKANMPTGSLVIDVPVENDVGNPMPAAYHLRMVKKNTHQNGDDLGMCRSRRVNVAVLVWTRSWRTEDDQPTPDHKGPG
jgi:hypothetical protein